jgi:hypothetical protein
MSLRVTTLGAREKIVVTQKRPSQPSLPSEGWGLGWGVGCTSSRVPHSSKQERGDSARKVFILKFL